jgi:two-component sensor histidine kinase/CheY-like chemotaxis protein
MKKEKTILLVEDEVFIAVLQKKSLEKYGYTVLSVSSGEAAIEALIQHPGTDLILMDINLGPGMDGTETAEIILRERDIPIVFLSSHTDPAIVEKTEGISSYGYVVKDSGITVLDASIKMAFRLFNEKQKVRGQRMELETANEELAQTIEELEQTNEELEKSRTEILETTNALSQSESFIRAVMDNLPIGVAVNSVDPAVEFSYMNDNFPAVYRTTRKSLEGSDSFWENVYEEPRFREEIRKRVLEDCASGDTNRMQWDNVKITRNGRTAAYISARNIPIPGKKLMISTVWDNTERKLAEQELERSVKEKQTLLMELQHRVKNSFSMINAIIGLMSQGRTPEVRSALEELGTRVNVFTEMYDLLYSTGFESEVRLDEYINRITSSLPGMSGDITLRKYCHSLTVPVKTAINLGIITIELISNSIKYAFPGRNSGVIDLSLIHSHPGIVFSIADNGIGLPEEFDIDRLESMGLKLVQALIHQMQGDIKIEGKEGTRCIIGLPLNAMA